MLVTFRRPQLYPKQEAAIFAPERWSFIEASTKAGKTVGCLVWFLEQSLQGSDGHNFWWVAPVFPQAKIAFRRLKKMLPREMFKANETELTITLANGAVMWFKSAEIPDNLYGEDVYAAVLDEASRMREDAYIAIRSTITATRAPVRVIGNVKGRKNWFYRQARKAESGQPDRSFHRITAQDAVDAGVLDGQEIEDARRDLPESVFAELYGAVASDDEGNPFGITAIGQCVRPLSTAVPAAWGWDLAKSYDWTVGAALDSTAVVCRLHRWQRPWNETTDAIIEETGTVPATIDATGVGDPVLERLQVGRKNFEGFKFTSQSKQQLMEGLAVAIQKGEIGFPDGVIRQELEAFEYVYTRTGVRYSAPEGMHDDTVCALALAWHQKTHMPVRRTLRFAGYA